MIHPSISGQETWNSLHGDMVDLQLFIYNLYILVRIYMKDFVEAPKGSYRLAAIGLSSFWLFQMTLFIV